MRNKTEIPTKTRKHDQGSIGNGRNFESTVSGRENSLSSAAKFSLLKIPWKSKQPIRKMGHEEVLDLHPRFQ